MNADSKSPPTFIAQWEAARGVKVVAMHPRTFPLDAESVANQIFMTFDMAGSDSAQSGSKGTVLSLTLGRYSKKIRLIYLGGKRIFIIGVILPEFFVDIQEGQFDETLQAMGADILSGNLSPEAVLEAYLPKLTKIFTLEQHIQDAEIRLEPNYSLQSATQDFQQGLLNFKSGNPTRAYFLLRKADLFFGSSGQKQQTMDISYILGTILQQQKKFSAAQDQYKRLWELGEEMQNQKYIETGLFMAGSCALQREAYGEAVESFQRLGLIPLRFISHLTYHFQYGLALYRLEKPESAIEEFLKALEAPDPASEKVDNVQKLRAQVLLSLGAANHQLLAQQVRKGPMEEQAFRQKWEKVLDYYISAASTYEKIGEFPQVIELYQVIGNYYGTLGDAGKFLDFYDKALQLCESSNKILQKFAVFQRVVQKQAELNQHEKIVEEVDSFLGNIGSHAYMDLAGMGRLHYQLGASLAHLGKLQDGFSEFLIAFNIFRKEPDLTREQQMVLRAMAELSRLRGDADAEEYYTAQLKEATARGTIVQKDQVPAVGGANGIVKEIWIYLKSGEEIFRYSPESQFDAEMLGGFLLAFQNFSKEVTSQQLKAMSIGSDNFTFYADPAAKFFVMGRASQQSSLEQVEFALRAVSHKFEERFREEMENFKGDLKPFRIFGEDLVNIYV